MSKEYVKLIKQAQKSMRRGQQDRAIELAETAVREAAIALGEAHKEAFSTRRIYHNLLFVAGQYSRAQKVIDEDIATDSRLYGPLSKEVGLDYRQMGMVYKNMDERQKAKDMFSKAIFIFKKTPPEADILLGDCYFYLGDIAADERDLKEMNSWFEKAATIYKNHLDTRGNWWMLANSQMLRYAIDLGELSKARALGRGALSLMDKCEGLDKGAPEDLHSLVARVEYRLGNMDLAVSSYIDAYKAGKKARGSSAPSYLKWLTTAWEMERMSGNVRGSLELINYIKKELKDGKKDDVRNTIELDEAMAWCYFDSGDIKTAISTLRKALEKAGGQQHAGTEIGLAKIELGRIVHLSGNLDEGERLLEEGRDSFDRRQRFGFEGELIPYYQYKLDILLERGLYGEAYWILSKYRMAVLTDFLYAEHTPEHAQYGLYNTSLYKNWKGFDAYSSGYLEVISRRALEEAQVSFSEWHPALTPFIIGLSEVMTLSGEPEASVVMLERMRAVLSATFPKGHRFIIDVLMAIAKAEEGRGDHRRAREALNQAIQNAHLLWGDHHPVLAEIYLQLSSLHLNAGDLSRAEQTADMALHSDHHLVGTMHERAARVFAIKATIQERKGNTVSAGNFLKSVLEIYRGIYGADHRLVRETDERIAHLGQPLASTASNQSSIGGPDEISPVHAPKYKESSQQSLPRHLRLRKITIMDNPVDEFACIFPDKGAVSNVMGGKVESAIECLTQSYKLLQAERDTKSRGKVAEISDTDRMNEKMAHFARGIGLLYLSRNDRWSAGLYLGRAYYLFQEVFHGCHPEVLRTYAWLTTATDGWEAGQDETTHFIRENAKRGLINVDKEAFGNIRYRGIESKKKGELGEAEKLLGATAELQGAIEIELTSDLVGSWAEYCDILILSGKPEQADRILDSLLQRWVRAHATLEGFSTGATICKAKTLKSMGHHKETIELLERLLKGLKANYSEDILEIRLLLADAYYNVGDRPKCVELLSESKKMLGKHRCKKPEGDRLASYYGSLSKLVDVRDKSTKKS